VGIFTVPATLSNAVNSDRRITLDLIVDTGAVYTMLPATVVEDLGLETPRERRVMLASGEQVTYPVGIVNLGLHGEEWPTFFLEGPPGSLALLGAFTLEGFALAPDPVNKRLVPVVSLLACSSGRSVNEGPSIPSPAHCSAWTPRSDVVSEPEAHVHTAIRGGQPGCVAISPRATSSRGAEV
jgi:predicted aspartyl protease